MYLLCKDSRFCGWSVESMKRALLDLCKQCEITTSQIFSFGIDGAAVMTGKHTGVARCLSVHNPELVYLHCGTHRVASAHSQVTHSVILKTFNSHLVTFIATSLIVLS